MNVLDILDRHARGFHKTEDEDEESDALQDSSGSNGENESDQDQDTGEPLEERDRKRLRKVSAEAAQPGGPGASLGPVTSKRVSDSKQKEHRNLNKGRAAARRLKP